MKPTGCQEKTLRDEFAMCAMQLLEKNPYWMQMPATHIVREAFRLADLMMAEHKPAVDDEELT